MSNNELIEFVEHNILANKQNGEKLIDELRKLEVKSMKCKNVSDFEINQINKIFDDLLTNGEWELHIKQRVELYVSRIKNDLYYK